VSSIGEIGGHDHVGENYITYNRRGEGIPRPDFPPFPPNSEEEEEVHREAKRRLEHEAECEAERIMGGMHER
jgi:hypothetical protein